MAGPVWDSNVFSKSITYRPTLSKFRGGGFKKNTLYIYNLMYHLLIDTIESWHDSKANTFPIFLIKRNHAGYWTSSWLVPPAGLIGFHYWDFHPQILNQTPKDIWYLWKYHSSWNNIYSKQNLVQSLSLGSSAVVQIKMSLLNKPIYVGGVVVQNVVC